MRVHLGRCGLIELLIVLTLIAVMVVILYPLFQQGKEVAVQKMCMSHQQQIASLLTIYAVDHDGHLPDQWREPLRGQESLLVCTAKKALPVGYGFNANLLGKDMKVLGLEGARMNQLLLLADGGDRSRLIDSMRDIDQRRHEQGFVAIFADGHAEFLKAGTAVKLK